MSLDLVKSQLSLKFKDELLDQLLDAYMLSKEYYVLGRYRPACFEAGRFAEVGLRILQQLTTGNYLPLDSAIKDFASETYKFTQVSKTHFRESIRLQIPRALQLVYDIRNKRNVGHVKGDIDENYADARLSVTTISWILAGLLRLYYVSDMNEAQKLVDNIMRANIPLIQDFDGYLKILDPKLKVPTKVLLLAYHRGKDGAKFEELQNWLKGVSVSHLRTTLNTLEFKRAFLHASDDRYFITETGILFVEENILAKQERFIKRTS